MKQEKILSGALILSLLLGGLTACSKTRKEQLIKEDDPWYSSTRIELGANTNCAEYSEYHFEMPVVSDEFIAIQYYGHNIDKETGNYDVHLPICLFDRTGSLISELDVSKDDPGATMLGVLSEGDNIAVYYNSSDGSAHKMYCDKNTGEVSSPQDTGLDLKSSDRLTSCNSLGDYSFFTKSNSVKSTLYVYKNGENVFEKEMEGTDFSLTNVSMQDGKYKLQLIMNEWLYDPENNTLEILPSDGLMIQQYQNTVTGFDGRTYVSDADGIYTDGELYFQYSDSDALISELRLSSLYAVDEDCIIFINMQNYDGINENPVLTILNKSDKNPNAGKKVINATSYDPFLNALASKGIMNFNSSDSEYFIKYKTLDITNELDGEELDEAFKKAVLSSDGPDIIFGVNDLWWMMNDSCLMDLSSDVSLDPNAYCTKLIDSAKSDNKLYYIPLDFMINGILTDKKYVREGATGFTYEEYRNFVYDTCNGNDPLGAAYDREEYFETCLGVMKDIWYNNGEIDLDNDAFKGLAEYVKNNVPKNISETDDLYNLTQSDLKNNGRLAMVTDYRDFVRTCYEVDDPVVMGYPSVDGRGPCTQFLTTVAVNAQTNYKDGCLKFITTLLSGDVQEMTYSSPINKEAARSLAESSSVMIDSEYDKALSANIISEASAWSNGYYHNSGELIDIYLDTLESVSGTSTMDTSIKSIVHEEIGAYLADQKTLDDLKKTLGDRLKTLSNENR